jgi:hypothetical protein
MNRISSLVHWSNYERVCLAKLGSRSTQNWFVELFR